MDGFLQAVKGNGGYHHNVGSKQPKNVVAICSDGGGYKRNRFWVSKFKSLGLSCYI